MAKKISADDFEKIKKRAGRLKDSYSEVVTNNKDSADAYWMKSQAATISGKDPSNLKAVISPTPSNMVDGGSRLMTAIKPTFEMVVPDKEKTQPNLCENLANTILEQSNAVKRAPIQVDASRSALLYGDVHFRIKWLPDMLKSKFAPARKSRLERIQEMTPVLIEAMEPGYAEFDGDLGLIGYLRVRDLTGSKAVSEYGEAYEWEEEKEYEIWDWYDETNRCVWIAGADEPLPDWSGAHKLDEIPIVVTVSEGSELFDKEEYRRRPFLWKYLKSGMWDWETSLLTLMRTSMHERGTGPLLGIDPEGLDPNQPIQIHWEGGVRYMVGKAKMLNDKSYDPEIIQALDMLNTLAGESMLYRQALGQPLGNGNAAFSAVALLSQSGRLPLASPSEAVGKAFADAMSIIFRRIRKEGCKQMKKNEVPKEFTMKATIEVKLAQDMLRNAQIVRQLTQGENPLISNEWGLQNIMGINDPSAVQKQAMKERYMALRFMAMAQKFIAMQTQPAPQPMPPGAATAPTGAPPEGMPPGAPPMPQELTEPINPAEAMPPEMTQ